MDGRRPGCRDHPPRRGRRDERRDGRRRGAGHPAGQRVHRRARARREARRAGRPVGPHRRRPPRSHRRDVRARGARHGRREPAGPRRPHRRRRAGRRPRRLGRGDRGDAAGGWVSSAVGAGPARGPRPVTLGLRANAAQFTLLVAVNALVGGMLGQERTVLPLLATRTFHLTAYTAALTSILAFGVAKAATNYVAGTWSDRYGRKPVLVAGWLVAVPVPLLLIWAPSWGW